jgi:oligopeptide transport system ATP-binding protein
MKPLFRVKDLHINFKTYLGIVQAVRGISFSLEEGETLAIVGESGCGKSATAQALLGLIPKPPGEITQGEILFENEDLLLKSSKEMNAIRGSSISMIFQDPMTSLNPTMRIGKQIIEPLLKQGIMKKEAAKNRVLELLNLVGISHVERRFNQFPHEFSGGMRQRAVIAMALACSPKILIADEPTTALDVTIQAQILDLIKNIQKKTKTSIILITHDLGIVARMCDRILVMYAGKIVERGSTEDIFYRPQHPYTKGLLNSVPCPNKKQDRLIPIPGSPPDLLHLPKGCAFTQRCPVAMEICPKMTPMDFEESNTHSFACWQGHELSGDQ